MTDTVEEKFCQILKLSFGHECQGFWVLKVLQKYPCTVYVIAQPISQKHLFFLVFGNWFPFLVILSNSGSFTIKIQKKTEILSDLT